MKQSGKENRKKSNVIFTAIISLIFLAGLGIILYPTFSNWHNERVQTKVISNYEQQVAGMKQEDYTRYFQAADAYNARLQKVGFETANAAPDMVPGYEETLDVTGTGIMGYIQIPKIKVNLAVYHGTDPSVLQVAAGHFEGTSLPVGGKGTHSVISAHTGLPGAKLFTDLDQLEKGDLFTITILNRTLTYQVDRIDVVLPDQLELLDTVEGKDYCTLLTCTPYGVNDHRLLVRGVRIANQTTDADAQTTKEDVQEAVKTPYEQMITVLKWVIFPLILSAVVLVTMLKRKKK